jgi:H+/Cl- antiporter ClcA
MAMVGAAAAATGVTQTLSTAILIVEMTGEFDVLILAMVISVLVFVR